MPLARTLFRPALALVVGVLLFLQPGLMTASNAATGESITLSASADADVLAGERATVTLTAKNDGTVPEYNLSFRYVLPAGVSYVAGSAGVLGDPVVRTAAGVQTLIWANVSDLPVDAEQKLSFKVTHDTATWRVGSVFSGTATAYASADERTVPKFSADGAYTSGASTQATAPAATTKISAIKVEKSEPSPEHELVRGVHAHPTTYTLKVTNNAVRADNDVTLVDLLPAQLEFLGCGTVDNTASGVVEYPGAPRLDAVADLTTDCRTPASVTTVSNPAGHPAGIYTRVEWNLGSMAPGQVIEVKYAAAIPQRANTLDFGRAVSGTSLEQAANLDNNTGPSTRETTGEQALTNRATVTATYTGPVADGTSTAVAHTDTLTVTAEDLAIQKSSSTRTFAQGKVATWTLDLQTGEYADASDIVITDELPDGLCPIGFPGLTTCTHPDAEAPSVPYQSVTENADGSYTIVFEAIDLAASRTRTITFDTLMRSNYRENNDDDVVTVAGDAYVNEVSLTATTTVLGHVDPPAGDPVTRTVRDESSAGIEGESVQLDKRIQPNTARPYTCSTTPGDYEDTGSDFTRFTYSEGSRVCFLLKVQFPDDVHTKNPVLKDFLPEGLTYEGGAAMPGNQVASTVDASNLTFQLGTVQGSNRYVDPGQLFLYRVSAIVTTPPTTGTPDVPGNLAKLTWTNTDGRVSFLRDQVDFRVPPAPPVAVTKTSTRSSVKAGDVADFTVTLRNNGSTADGNAVDVVAPDVWDRLPRGITCAQVSAVSDGGACTDPGAATHPTFTDRATRSAIRWDLPTTVRIAPGATKVLTYRVTYPDTVAANGTYRNDVDVARYRSETNRETLVDHHPASNVDTTVTPAMVDAPVAHSDHTVTVPSTSVTKTNTTAVDDATQGAGANHLVAIGEKVTYTVMATLPASTTVYGGVLTDTLPSGLRFDRVVSYELSVDGSTWQPLPAGWTTDRAKVTLPTPYAVDGTADRVRMVVEATVVDVAATKAQDGRLRNTVTLVSSPQFGGTPTTRSATSDVYVVHPVPSVGKQADRDEAGTEGVINYTVTARNVGSPASQRRPTLFESVAVDCVPAGLTVDPASFVVTGVASGAAVAPGSATLGTAGTNGCATDATPIVWQVGDLDWRADGATWPTLAYSVNVSSTAGGGAAYVNTVRLSGSSMDGTVADERTDYSATANETVAVPAAGLTKSVTPSRAPVGSTVTYTVTGQVPARVNLYDTTLVDTLPVGILPSSVELESVEWAYGDGGTPATPTGMPTAQPLVASGTAHGWYFGRITSDVRPRTVTVTYTAVVSEAEATNRAGTTRPNTASLRWNTTQQITGSDLPTTGTTFEKRTTDATATVTVQEPSLSVTKSVSRATPKPGDTFTYTVTVTNATGTNVSTAHDVDVVDDVPAGVRVVPGTISNGGVLAGTGAGGGNGTITWTDLAALAPGASRTLTYEARLVSPAPTSAQTNTVEVTGYTSLDDGGRTYSGPDASATVTPALPELDIVKSLVGTAPAYRGEPSTWRLVVTNTGDATAHDVDVTDLLPADWTYRTGSARVSFAGATATSVEPTVTGRSLAWTNLGDLEVTKTIVIDFQAVPGADAAVGSTAAHTNTAATAGKDLDGGSVVTEDDDSATARIHSADLEVTKTAPTTAPVAGADYTWTIRVTNNGGDPAVNVRVTDTLPSGVTYQGSSSGNNWLFGGGWGDPATVTATLLPELASGASAEFTVTGRLADSIAPGTVITNTATVTADTHDPDLGDNSTSVTSTVTTVPDMGIRKTLGATTIVPGAEATYTLAVTNHGPSRAHGAITVTDTLPSGLSYVSHTGDDWKLVRDGQELTFTWDGDTPVDRGAMEQITVTVAVASSVTGTVTNTASVTEPTDPTSGPEQPDNDTVSTPVVPSADLALEKSSVGPVRAGEEATYRFTVTNHGPSDAAGPLTVTDTLPAQLTYVGVDSADAWTCSAVGQALTCELAAGLTVGKGSTAFEVTVDVDAALTGSVVNTATVSSPTADPHTPNNTDSDDSSVGVLADLGIEKRLVTSPVVAGEQVTYELEVTNHGSAVSPGTVTATDTLPAGLTFVSAAGTDWACSATGQVVECERALALSPRTAAPTVTVVALVDSGLAAGDVVNVASVSGPATDPVPTNNTDSVPTTVTQVAELEVTKTTTGADPVRAGENATFEIEVRNTGSSDARNVVVDDLLPAGMTLVEVDGTGWTCEDGTCTRDRIVAGRTAPVLTVVAKVASGTPDGTTLTNRVEVSTSTPGDDPRDNSDSADVGVVAEADLVLKKKHTGTAVAGTTTTFELAVTNEGPSDAVGPLTVTDRLPAGMSFLSATAPWDCTPLPGREVECVLPDGLVAGQSAPVLTVQVQIGATVESGPLTNTAVVDSPTTDPVPGNDSDDETVEVQRYADVSVTKSHTGPVRVGDELEFTLRVRNDGPSEARDVVVVDTLPEGLELVSVDGKDWDCTTAGVVSCALDGPLAPGTDAESITVVTKVLPGAYPEVVNTAKVSTSTPDPKPENDTDSDVVEVPAQVDLAVKKSLKGTLVVGERATYKIVVTNNGPTSAPGEITVTDLLPTGLTFVSAGDEDWTCTADGRTVTCTFDGPLGVGDSTGFAIEVEVRASAYPEVVNTAAVNSPSEDLDPENDEDRVTSSVTPTIDLGLTKEVKEQDGRKVTYLLTVTNAGPSATVDPVVVRDELPDELELVRIGGTDWSCGDEAAECTYTGSLAAGESAELTVVTRIVGDPTGKIVNVATVEGGGDTTGTGTGIATIEPPSKDDPTEPGDPSDPSDPRPGDPSGNGRGDGPLPDTGGPQLWVLLAGLVLAVAGAWTVRRNRERV